MVGRWPLICAPGWSDEVDEGRELVHWAYVIIIVSILWEKTRMKQCLYTTNRLIRT